MTTKPCLILEWSDSAEWPALSGSVRHPLKPVPLRIPAERRPTILHPNCEIAEAEAQRLALLHPEKKFAVFEATVVACAVDVPSHVTTSGKVWLTRKHPVLLEIDDSEVPF